MTKGVCYSVLYPGINQINKYLLNVYCVQIALGWAGFKSHPTFQSDKSKHYFISSISEATLMSLRWQCVWRRQGWLTMWKQEKEYSRIPSMDYITYYVCMCECVCEHKTVMYVFICPYAHVSTQKTMSVCERKGSCYGSIRIDAIIWIY